MNVNGWQNDPHNRNKVGLYAVIFATATAAGFIAMSVRGCLERTAEKAVKSAVEGTPPAKQSTKKKLAIP